MPDLEALAVADWLRAREPDAPASMTDPAPVDRDDGALDALLSLGNALDGAAKRDGAALGRRLAEPGTVDALRAAMLQIGGARRLRLMAWMGDGPGAVCPEAVVALFHNDAAGFLKAELLALHRRALLGRIFSAERISALVAACSAAGKGGP